MPGGAFWGGWALNSADVRLYGCMPDARMGGVLLDLDTCRMDGMVRVDFGYRTGDFGAWTWDFWGSGARLSL